MAYRYRATLLRLSEHRDDFRKRMFLRIEDLETGSWRLHWLGAHDLLLHALFTNPPGRVQTGPPVPPGPAPDVPPGPAPDVPPGPAPDVPAGLRPRAVKPGAPGSLGSRPDESGRVQTRLSSDASLTEGSPVERPFLLDHRPAPDGDLDSFLLGPLEIGDSFLLWTEDVLPWLENAVPVASARAARPRSARAARPLPPRAAR